MELTRAQLHAALAARAPAHAQIAVDGDARQQRLRVTCAAMQATVSAREGGGWQVAASREDDAEFADLIDATLRQHAAAWPVDPPAPQRERLDRDRAAAELGAEWPLLRDWLAFAERFGERGPQVWLQTKPAPAVLLQMPQVPAKLQSAYRFLLRLDNGIGDGRHLPDWMAQLGFAADASGELTTVPTPASFARLVADQTGRPPAIAPQLQPMAWFLAWERPWLQAMCAGVAAINMPPAGFYAAIAHSRLPNWAPLLGGLRRGMHGLLLVPAHDLTLHCVLQHRIPAADLAIFGAEIAASLVEHRGPYAPKPLCNFFEDDLSEHCQALWRRCETARDFDVLWPAALPKLRAALRGRLDQTRRLRGLGGVIPGLFGIGDRQPA